MRLDVLFDMETADPDDGFTLALLAAHPAVALRAVTVTPGTKGQVGVVREILRRVGASGVPVGARDPGSSKEAVSPFHRQYLGEPGPAEPDDLAHRVLAGALEQFPMATLLTGAPLQNPRLLLEEHPGARVARWVGQGGFAGDDLVSPEHRLAKFAGRATCPTFNFNGDPKGAKLLLASDRVGERILVSKNVCHSVCYDAAMHARLAPFAGQSAGLRLVHEAMGRYLEQSPGGKLLHDPLAACVAIDPSIVTLREVEVFREKGEWGSRAASGTGTRITVAVDHEAFFATLVGDRAGGARAPAVA